MREYKLAHFTLFENRDILKIHVVAHIVILAEFIGPTETI